MKGLLRVAIAVAALLGAALGPAGSARAEPHPPPLPPTALPDPGLDLPPPVLPSVGPRHRVSAFVSLFGELGPRKAGYSTGLAYRLTYSRSENILWDGLYVEPQVEVFPNPFIPSYRVQVALLPIAFFKLIVAYTNYFFLGWDNDLGLGLTFPDADAPFDPATLAARRGEDVRQWVQRVEVRPVLQLQIGRLIVFNDAELALWLIDGPGDFFYDPLYDSLLRRGRVERVLMNRSAIAVEAWRGRGEARFIVGVANQVVRTFGAGIFRDRLGLALVAIPWDRLGRRARPTLLVQPGLTLADRNRRFDPFLELYLLVHFDLVER